MAFCRFGDADIYLYSTSEGRVVCCACPLAGLVPTIFTTGGLLPAPIEPIVFDPCPHCEGRGCTRCMMHDTTILEGPADAIAHVAAHREAGHYVPNDVDSALRRLQSNSGTEARAKGWRP